MLDLEVFFFDLFKLYLASLTDIIYSFRFFIFSFDLFDVWMSNGIQKFDDLVICPTSNVFIEVAWKQVEYTYCS